MARQHLDLAPEDGLGRAGLPLRLALADARDHAEARGERRLRPLPDRVVGLPEDWRRSEWPTSAPWTPSSTSICAEISPVKAPSGAQWTFCA